MVYDAFDIGVAAPVPVTARLAAHAAATAAAAKKHAAATDASVDRGHL